MKFEAYVRSLGWRQKKSTIPYIRLSGKNGLHGEKFFSYWDKVHNNTEVVLE